jgi:hypothetical protein
MEDDATRWFSPVRGDEHILLGRDSPLRRIPVHVHPKHAIFLDGMRHALEVMDVGFSRLRKELTRLALKPPEPADLPLVSASVFLDAWAVIDAIDKFRQLYLNFPGIKSWSGSTEVQPLRDVLQTFRNLRNVGDHLIGMSDQILAKGGAAFGELTWLTGAQVLPDVVAWHCVLRPGTFQSEPSLPTETIETTLDWPTDCICLVAGGKLGNLSQVRTHIAGRVRHLESQLTEIFAKPENACVPVINDFFSRRPVKPAPPGTLG